MVELCMSSSIMVIKVASMRKNNHRMLERVHYVVKSGVSVT
jgi:hypothetical protein